MSARILAIAVFCLAPVACAKEDAKPAGDAAEIGASLNDKREVYISDVPADVLAAARAVRPSVAFVEAEYEKKNGVDYYEVAGLNEAGVEIELDIMRDGDKWRVVEIQRDISLDEAPEPVSAALFAAAPGVAPARIIESDQGDGVVIYEFYTKNDSGVERKYEVKFDGATAEFLTEEWAH
ncbi:MAG: hypothetical protein WD076_11820, partial [Parvularculaceae bacterium]